MTKFTLRKWEDVKPLSDTDAWIIDGYVSAFHTMFYGESKAGKSSLVSAVIASLVCGTPFLEVSPNRKMRVAVFGSDDGAAEEYKERILSAMPEEMDDPGIGFYQLGTMHPKDWSDAVEAVRRDGYEFVVIDNVEDCIDGDPNTSQPWQRLYNGTRGLLAHGIPVLLVHHASDKTFQGKKSSKPGGHYKATASVRHRVHVRKVGKVGRVDLDIVGNRDMERTVRLMRTGLVDFEVVGEDSAEDLQHKAEESRQKRDAETFDKNLEKAKFVVAECQSMSELDAGTKMVERFGGTPGSNKTFINNMKGTLLSKEGRGSATVWTLIGE
ncbi:AAA family ATPase [Prescottella equi]|uniref:AAA family ATPase n=1 Tax=Rhodococcus hoagii TaxID=43767 RepID=UPI001C781818|nr:AAA family ATPase [Prescottella equi]BCN45261.1 hypothetical protein RE9414_35410 [Prescottella equi]